MISALVTLLVFQLLGEVTARAFGLPLPGPVIGMVALFVACVVVPRLADLLRPLVQVLLGHLSLLFVPVGVGIVSHLDLLREDGLAIAAALVISTLAAIAAGALVFVAVVRITGGGDPRGEGGDERA